MFVLQSPALLAPFEMSIKGHFLNYWESACFPFVGASVLESLTSPGNESVSI